MKKNRLFIIHWILQILLVNNVFAVENAQDFYLQKILENSSNKRSYYFDNINTYKYVNLQVNAVGSKNLESLIGLFDEKENDNVIKYLKDNYGARYILETNNFLGFKIGKNTFEISTSGGLVLDINNPIMPEVQGKILHDMNVNYAREFNYGDFKIIPKLVAGKRKFYNEIIRPDNFLKEEKYEFRWSEFDYDNFIDLDIEARHYYNGIEFMHSVTSIPISGYRPVDYWKVNTGAKYNFLEENLITMDIWGKVSPIYYGTYDWDNLLELGISTDFLKVFNYALYYQYKGVNMHMDVDLIYLRLRGYYKNHNFNNFGYSNKQYGAEVSFNW